MGSSCADDIQPTKQASAHSYVKHAETLTFEKLTFMLIPALIFLPVPAHSYVSEIIATNASGPLNIYPLTIHGTTVGNPTRCFLPVNLVASSLICLTKCTAEDCQEAFAKHHQLRAHICAEHAPSGTKPYRCEHEGCSKSFNTNQHLKTHQKTHDGESNPL